jgi:hypothetical protein
LESVVYEGKNSRMAEIANNQIERRIDLHLLHPAFQKSESAESILEMIQD